MSLWRYLGALFPPPSHLLRLERGVWARIMHLPGSSVPIGGLEELARDSGWPKLPSISMAIEAPLDPLRSAQALVSSGTPRPEGVSRTLVCLFLVLPRALFLTRGGIFTLRAFAPLLGGCGASGASHRDSQRFIRLNTVFGISRHMSDIRSQVEHMEIEQAFLRALDDGCNCTTFRSHMAG